MDASLAAAIGGPVLGLSAIVAAEMRGSRERRQAVLVARERHEHERALERGRRLFEHRAKVYEDLLHLLGLQIEGIERTNPTIQYGAPKEPPPLPPTEETDALQAKVGTLGSPNVWDLTVKFGRARHRFFVASSTLEMIRADPRSGLDLAGAWEKLEERREEARDIFTEIRTAIQAEIDAL